MRRRVLITGATDGIGLALAGLYDQEGAELTLIGRRQATALGAPFFSKRNYCQADLAEADAVDRIAAFLRRERRDELDMAILNAGTGWVGPIGGHDALDIRRLVAVNLATPIALAHFLLPLLSGGRLVLVGSIAAAMPCPDYAVYAATKAGLDGLARSLRIELKGQVDVMVVHPGPTLTGMHDKAGAKLDARRFPSAIRVAVRIKKSIERRSGSQVIGRRNAMLWSVARRFANVIDPALYGVRSLSSRGPRASSVGGRLAADKPMALVTGAANGIGLALSRRLADQGYGVLAVDIDEPALAAMQTKFGSLGHEYICADLADAMACETTLNQVRKWSPITLLVHCAGTSSVGRFGNIDIDAHRRTLNVNLLAPILLTAGALRHRLVRAGGAVVFVSSLSHFVSYPGASVYAASKDGVASFARSLYVAGATQGPHCLSVFPGPTRTSHARRFSPKGASEARRMAPDRVATHIVDAVGKQRRSVVPGGVNQAFAIIGRQLPGLTERVMRRLVFEPLALEGRAGK